MVVFSKNVYIKANRIDSYMARLSTTTTEVIRTSLREEFLKFRS